jgi:hypothetical protein
MLYCMLRCVILHYILFFQTHSFAFLQSLWIQNVLKFERLIKCSCKFSFLLFFECSLLMAICFSRNMALFLNLSWIYVVFDWLEVGFILNGTEDTTGMNRLKVFLPKTMVSEYQAVRCHSSVDGALLIVTTGRTSSLTDPTIKKRNCLGKAEVVNVWFWYQNRDRNQWWALASKVTKL